MSPGKRTGASIAPLPVHPVGLALAGDLGWRSIDCELIEQADGRIPTPKMNEVNIRTMEFCRRWRIDDVHNCPFPPDWPMDVVFGTSMSGFMLLRFGDDAASAEGLARAVAERCVPFETVDIDDAQVAAFYERALVLVRPDGHVAWRADAPPDDPGALVDLVRGAS